MNSNSTSHSLGVSRLFSNLEPVAGTLKHQPGSVLGSTALVAGTTVGAGILALPAVTLASGVLPSTVMLITLWFYVLASGLLIAEVQINWMRTEGHQGAGLLTLIQAILGKSGARLTAGIYLFQHYALLIAYMTQGGEILLTAIAHIIGIPENWPPALGTLLFTGIFGSILYFGRERLVEKLNNVFVAIVLFSFIGLIVLSRTTIDPGQFRHQDWGALSPAVSVMFVALFYHNVIPVVTTQLEGDVQKIRRAIGWGSLVPLLMFLVWNAMILGSVSPEIAQDHSAFDPLQVLRRGEAGAWLGGMVSIFSEFAIITSFIGFVYGLLDIFKDVLAVSPHDPSKRLSLYSLVLLPSMGLSTLNPDIFFTALDYAGTFSITLFSGILPAAMAWKQRDRQTQSDRTQRLVPGGKLVLALMISVGLAVIGRQIVTLLSK